jgi:hypothetical protein
MILARILANTIPTTIRKQVQMKKKVRKNCSTNNNNNFNISNFQAMKRNIKGKIVQITIKIIRSLTNNNNLTNLKLIF